MARSRYTFADQNTPHFVTTTTVQWLPIFSAPPVAQIILDSLQFLQNEGRITLFAYVLLENHAHLIASAADLSREIASFKSYTARRIIDHLEEKQAEHVLQQLARNKLAHRKDRMYQVWQEGSHAQMIQGEAMMRQKIEYVHHNPVKRGYVDEPAHWRYSSARNYAGQEGLISVETNWLME